MMEHLEHVVVLPVEIATYFDGCLDLQQSWLSPENLLCLSDEPPDRVDGRIDKCIDLLDDGSVQVKLILRTSAAAEVSPLSSGAGRIGPVVLQWLSAYEKLLLICELLVVVQVVDDQVECELLLSFVSGITPVAFL